MRSCSARLAGSRDLRQRLAACGPAAFSRNRKGQSGLCGLRASPATCRSCCCGSRDAENLRSGAPRGPGARLLADEGPAVDLVIWNEDRVGYRQTLQDQIMGLIAAGAEAHVVDQPGGIFVRRVEQIPEEDRVLLQAVARIVIRDRRRYPARNKSTRRGAPDVRVPRCVPTRPPPDRTASVPPLPARDLDLFQRHRAASRPTAASTSLRCAAGRADAGAVGQRHRQPALRHGRQRERQRLHLVRERPRVPPDALVQRPGRPIPAARPSTSATRNGRFWSPARACPAAAPALRLAPRLRLQRLRARARTASRPSCACTSPSTRR